MTTGFSCNRRSLGSRNECNGTCRQVTISQTMRHFGALSNKAACIATPGVSNRSEPILFAIEYSSRRSDANAATVPESCISSCGPIRTRSLRRLIARSSIRVTFPQNLAEAVCSQCHLQGDYQIAPRDGRAEDYRPGLPLRDYRLEFRIMRADDKLKVAGHVEQLHQSRCYQGTKTLTCTTCHEPHQKRSSITVSYATTVIENSRASSRKTSASRAMATTARPATCLALTRKSNTWR